MAIWNTSRNMFATLLTMLFSLGILNTNDTLLAQNALDYNWPDHALARLKAIYDRGEFRAKAFQPSWSSDSTGFTLKEVDVNTGERKAWFYDAKTGDRSAAAQGNTAAESNVEGNAAQNKLRLESRDGKLLAIQPTSQREIVLATSPTDRTVEYRNTILSPDGSKVLFVEADFTDVKQRAVLVPSDPSYPEVQRHRFARVGGDIERLRVGVVNADGAELQWLRVECPKEGMYLGQVDWAGNSDEVLVERFSRFRDKREFFLARTNGEVKTIFSESNEAWVESSQGKNSGLVWIRGGKEFNVISEKDGWRHAFRYSRDGKELALLTPGDYDIIDRAVIDQENNGYYFYASPNDATQKYLFRVTLDGSAAKRISPEGQIGTHGYLFSPDTKWAIHSFSTLNSPPVHQLIEVETHRVVRLLENNEVVRDRMLTIPLPPVEFLKLKIDNDIELDAWMQKPKDFDPARKYPLFIYIYGEPHAQTVLNEWGAAQIDFHRVVAELGYVVVSIDNRGTPAPKGAKWRRAIFGSLGPLSTDEQEAGLKSLANQYSFVDPDRVGIWGWSGGGSNTLNSLFRKPDSYHVGIAVVPKPQPHLYNAWFQEIYMQDREANPEGYQRSAPINFAAGLKGKLLIMTGSGETNTHIQIIEGLVDRLIALGKPFDYMVYPNRDHGLREGDGTLVHVRMHILRYLLNNLPAGPQ